MHIVIGIWTLLAVWLWGDWRNWQKYYPTMLFFALVASVYLFLYGKDTLWNPQKSLLRDKQMELLYLFIIMPGSALLFLSNFPVRLKNQIIHISKWILIFIVVEWIGYHYHKISYNSGWNIWWSLAIDCVTFPMLILHHIKPLLAIGISILISVGFMVLFPPLWG